MSDLYPNQPNGTAPSQGGGTIPPPQTPPPSGSLWSMGGLWTIRVP